MKISPDYEGRDDGYDNNTVRFYEEIDDRGYFYELYVLIDSKKAAIVITDAGVSIDFIDGSSIDTNIMPEGRYGKQKSLQWEQLRKIIRIIEATGAEGKVWSKEEMDKFYDKWKSLGEP